MTVRAQDGVELWATAEGEGEPVLLCHGGPGLWDTLDDVAGLLAGRAAVHRWDQRGCGRSEWRGPYSVARSVADLDAVREHFGLDTVTLLGHSWGAHLALRYALAHPERVTRLVYVSGTGIGAGADWQAAYKQQRRAALGPHLPRWEELRSKERTPAEDREMCVLQWSTDFAGPDRDLAMKHAERMAFPWRGVNFECNATINAETKAEDVERLQTLCAALDVPVTIVDGADDLRPRTSVDSLERALPRVSRVTLAGAGHLPWAEDPDGFLAAAMNSPTAHLR